MQEVLKDEPPSKKVVVETEPSSAPSPEMKISPTPEPMVKQREVSAPTDTLIEPTEEPLMGRGGSQHKYLQNLIKKIAQDRGYLATIEKPLFDGARSVDVALEKDEKKIAGVIFGALILWLALSAEI